MALKYKVMYLIMFFGYSGSGQSVNLKTDTGSKVRYVSFVVDGKKKKVDNRFSFTIVHNKDTIQAKFKGNRLIVPDLEDRLDYTIIFKYKNYSLSFDRISKKMLFPGQNYIWEFGVDNRPFEESLDLMSSGEYKTESSRQLQYLRLDPMEFGDGIRFVNRIR